MFWNTFRGPSLPGAEEAPEASCTEEGGTGDRRGTTGPEATSIYPQPQLPRGGKSQSWAIFGQTGKRKAEPGSSLPHRPTAQVKSLALCTEVRTGPTDAGPRAGLQEGKGWTAGMPGRCGPSLVLDQNLHFVHQVPRQLQDLLRIVPLSHFCKRRQPS